MKPFIIFFYVSLCSLFAKTQTINNQLYFDAGAENNNPSTIMPQIIQSENVKSCGMVKMRLAPLILKSSGALHPFYAPNNKFWHTRLFLLDSLVIPDSTALIDFGYHSDYTDLREDKCWSIAGFEISNMPKIGDTAHFEFCLISTAREDKFSPDIYFSKDMVFNSNAEIKDHNRFFYAGKFSKKHYKFGLEYAFIDLVVDKNFINYKWIHVVNHYPKSEDSTYQIGLIAPLHLIELNSFEKSDKYKLTPITFELNSNSLNEKLRTELKKITLQFTQDEKIRICSTLSNQGNVETSTFNSYLKIQAVIEELTRYGIQMNQMIILPPTLVFTKDEEANKTVVLEIIR